jgi:tetratricopeptide (TPR) repeat protein
VIGRWNARAVPAVVSPANQWVNAHAGIHPQLRTYLLGLLSARIGDAAAAERFAAELARLDDPPEAALRGTATFEWLDTLWAHELARVHARTIRAELFRHRGLPEDALRTLTSGRSDVDFNMARASPFFALSYERFMRAELLRALGRDAEALGWYAAMGEIYPYELVYLAPAHLRQGEIYEKLGQRAKAAEHYARFVELWQSCDPELRSVVEEVRRRLVYLGRS